MKTKFFSLSGALLTALVVPATHGRILPPGLFSSSSYGIGITENRVSYHEIISISKKGTPRTTAQICNAMTLSTQEEVDAFTCTEVTGHLTISGSDITNLDALSSLRKVENLSIMNNDNLTNLDGLHSLEMVTGNGGVGILISGNAMLSNIDALSSLREISSGYFTAIEITSNPTLKNIDGLSSLTTLSNGLIFSNNASLENVDGLKSLTVFEDFLSYIVLDNNPKLKNLDGLSSLKTMRGRSAQLQISNNQSLINIDGLSSLETMSGEIAFSLQIFNNPALKNINGLLSLSHISWGPSGNITIANNTSLQNLDGLSSIRTAPSQLTEAFSMEVIDNPALVRCCGLYPLFKLIGEDVVNSQVTMSGNGAGCTKEDILANGKCTEALANFSLINSQTGDVLNHFSEATTLDLGDSDFPKWIIRANTIPDNVGSVIFILDDRPRRIENGTPYTVPRHIVSSLTPGDHTLTGEVYSRRGGRGTAAASLTAIIKVVNTLAIENFEVISTSGEVLSVLEDGDQINIKDPSFESISIIANTSQESGGGVRFYLNNELYRSETQQPYALQGDRNGIINRWRPQAGFYNLKAVPFVRRSGKTYDGIPLQVNFEVISETVVETIDERFTENIQNEESPPANISIYPVPVHESLYINLDALSTEKLQLTIVNFQGRKIYEDIFDIHESTQLDLSQIAGNLEPGIYYIRVSRGLKGVNTYRFIKE